jgi:prepilin-type N-terminal cleavage/methylation domain-containing protein
MKNCGNKLKSSKGYTLTEMIVVIAIIAIMAGIASPSIVQWWTNLGYREAATTIYTLLKEAKNRTIKENREYSVQFSPVAPPVTQYCLMMGDRSYNSINWTSRLGTNPIVVAAPNWTNIPTTGNLNIQTTNMLQFAGPPNVLFVSFRPNGTANLDVLGGNFATIQIRDNINVRYTIQIDTSGRIQMRTGP